MPKIIFSPRRKRLVLQVLSSGEVVVKAPLGVSEALCHHFVDQHKEWIAQQYHQCISRPTYCEGEVFWYLGEQYPLRLVSSALEALSFDGNFFYLRADTVNIPQLFEQWYRKKAYELLSQRCYVWADVMRVTYTHLSVRDTQTRLGSCSSTNRLNFSFRLVMAPLELVDYVVIHELAHCRFKHHQKSFWDFVGMYCYDYQSKRHTIKKIFSSLVF